MNRELLLNNGNKMPSLGLGTWQLTGQQCIQAVKKALEVGYRHIDTALMYGNHQEIGQAIKDTKREDLFLTSKIWQDSLKRNEVPRACASILEELGTNYLDLLLIHWPNPSVRVQETLEAMYELQQQGWVKNIGVSNFTIPLLKEALTTGIQFSVNQVEFHPSLYQKVLLEFCRENNIVLTAYSPLGRGQDLRLPAIQGIAEKYQKPPAQVALNWILSKGAAAIPMAFHPEHIEGNFKTLEWGLEEKDIALIDEIGNHNRVVNPGFVDFED